MDGPITLIPLLVQCTTPKAKTSWVQLLHNHAPRLAMNFQCGLPHHTWILLLHNLFMPSVYIHSNIYITISRKIVHILAIRRNSTLWHLPVQTHKVGIGNSDSIKVTLDIVYSRSIKIVSGYSSTCKKTSSKGTLLYITLSSPWDCSTCLPVHPLVYLFIPTPSQLLWKAFSHAAIILRRLFVHISTTVCVFKTFTPKTNSTHQLVCIQCSAVNVRVTSMWTE